MDSIINKSPFFKNGITACVAALTNEISGSFFDLKGVGTTIKYTSPASMEVLAFKKLY